MDDDFPYLCDDREPPLPDPETDIPEWMDEDF
jgi:hypothetical protein